MMLRGLLPVWLVLVASGSAQADGADSYAIGKGLSVVIGGRSLDAQAARLGCAGCHGADGRGGQEGGEAAAPSILWADLAQATPLRPGYDDQAFVRAVTQGIDPAGRSLQMPRFAAPPLVMAGLQSHLTRLGADQRSGIDGLRIAVRVPADPMTRLAALAAIAAFNGEGGSWGRQVVPAEPGGRWFVDLDAGIDRLLARFPDAENQAADRALAQNPKLRRLSRADPRAALLLSDGRNTWFVGPPRDAVVWARRDGLSLDAARALAVASLILDALREAGPDATRSAMERALDKLDLAPVIISEIVPNGHEAPLAGD